MRKLELLALAKESAKNSKSSRKLTWCLAMFLASLVMIIVFCCSFMYVLTSSFESRPRGRIISIEQAAEGQIGGRLNEEEMGELLNSKDVEDYIKFNEYRLNTMTISLGNARYNSEGAKKSLRSFDTADGNVLFKYLRGIGAVTGSEVVGVGEAILTRDIADELGGDDIIGKKVSVSINNSWGLYYCLDDDNNPDNLPINAVARGEEYVKLPTENKDIEIMKDFKVVGIAETNRAREAIPNYEWSEQEAGKYNEHAPFSANESGVWINSKSVYAGEDNVPQVRKHFMFTSAHGAEDKQVLTYQFGDIAQKAQEVTESGKVFVCINDNVANGCVVNENVSLAPIDVYQVHFTTFAKGKKWYDNNIEKLKASFLDNTNLPVAGNSIGQYLDKTIDVEFGILLQGRVVLDFAIKLISIFGCLLTLALVISLLNSTAIYAKSKEESYNNLAKLGVDKKTLTTYRRADAFMACLKAIVLGGIIVAVIAAILFAGMFNALGLVMALGTKDILIMLGLSIITFVTASIVMTATMTAVMPRQSTRKKRHDKPNKLKVK